MIRTCSSCGKHNRLPASRLHQTAKCGACKAVIAPLAKPLEIANGAEFDELVGHASVPVLVDFWAAWCGPCRVVAPELEKLASRFGGRLLIAKVDTDRLSTVAGGYGIRGIPTLILFRRGREQARVSGAMPADVIVQRLGLESILAA